jgi:hypothetical protein
VNRYAHSQRSAKPLVWRNVRSASSRLPSVFFTHYYAGAPLSTLLQRYGHKIAGVHGSRSVRLEELRILWMENGPKVAAVPILPKPSTNVEEDTGLSEGKPHKPPEPAFSVWDSKTGDELPARPRKKVKEDEAEVTQSAREETACETLRSGGVDDLDGKQQDASAVPLRSSTFSDALERDHLRLDIEEDARSSAPSVPPFSLDSDNHFSGSYFSTLNQPENPLQFVGAHLATSSLGPSQLAIFPRGIRIRGEREDPFIGHPKRSVAPPAPTPGPRLGAGDQGRGSPYICRESTKCAGRRFNTLSEYMKHMRYHKPSSHRPIGCTHPGCDDRFLFQKDLNKHVQGVHAKLRYFCTVCGRSYNRHDARRRHMTSAHLGATIPHAKDTAAHMSTSSASLRPALPYLPTPTASTASTNESQETNVDPRLILGSGFIVHAAKAAPGENMPTYASVASGAQKPRQSLRQPPTTQTPQDQPGHLFSGLIRGSKSPPRYLEARREEPAQLHRPLPRNPYMGAYASQPPQPNLNRNPSPTKGPSDPPQPSDPSVQTATRTSSDLQATKDLSKVAGQDLSDPSLIPSIFEDDGDYFVDSYGMWFDQRIGQSGRLTTPDSDVVMDATGDMNFMYREALSGGSGNTPLANPKTDSNRSETGTGSRLGTTTGSSSGARRSGQDMYDPSLPFACSVCQRTYRSQDDLNHHTSRSHNPDSRRYACPHCDMAFTHPRELRRHTDSKHTEASDSPRHYCRRDPNCYYAQHGFPRSDHRDRHERNVHREEGAQMRRVSGPSWTYD